MSYDIHKDDWQWTDEVKDIGVVYSGDIRNDVTVARPVAPTSGVKARKVHPSQQQLALAASTVGVQATDQLWVVYTNTLRVTPSDPTSAAIILRESDKLTYDDGTSTVTYTILWLKTVVFDTQVLCYCRRNPGVQQQTWGN